MLGRGAVFLSVIALAVFAGVAAPRPASALAPPSPFTDLKTGKTASGLWPWFRNLVGSGGSSVPEYGTLVSGETATTQAGVKSMMYRAAVGGRFLPVLGTVATRLSVYGTAAYIGWRIYRHYQGSDETIDLWIDSSTLGADSLYNPLGVWGTHQDALRYESVAWTRQAGTRCSLIGLGSDCWILDVQAGGLFISTVKKTYRTNNQAEGSIARTHWPDWDACDAAAAVRTCMGGWDSYSGSLDANWGSQVAYMVDRTFQNLTGRTYGGYGTTVTTFPGEAPGGYPTVQVALPLPALGPDAGVTSESGGTLGSPTITTNYTAPDDAGSTAEDADGLLGAFDTPCGRALINHLAQPAFYPWVPGCIETAPQAEPEAQTMTLLRPLSTETYDDYIARLQAEGWVGTATLIELDPPDPTIGPNAVSKVGVTGSSGTWRRSLWPSTWPRIALSTDLTIYHNPATAPPVAPDPTDEEAPPGGGDVFDPGGCDPWLTADPDFSPLTSLSFGSKFPFGLFGWVAGALSSFDVAAVAPSWSFDITIPSTPVSPAYDLGAFAFDLDAFSPYMSDVRLVLSFVLWAGAAWFFATALLGLRAPGNPAEAVDEV